MLMKILGTGLTGLVGSRIVELLKDQYEFDPSMVDITDRNAIIEKIKSSDAPIVLHLAAKTDVDGCEKDKEKDIKILRYKDIKEQEEMFSRDKTAWAVNVYGTKNIVDGCRESSKKVIYISTDFVFDGSKDFYNEEDVPNPVNWYAKTKYEGEKIVQNSSIPWIIVRISYPYRSSFERPDFVRAILKRLQNNEKVLGVIDHKFSPTFIDDIAFGIHKLIEKKALGIFHVIGSTCLTPYDAAIAIATKFGLNKDLIGKTTREEFFTNRAKRPFHLVIKNDKIQRMGVKMRGFEDGLEEVKRQLANF
ncbi:MAG: hypothetical protein A3B41_01560 [Candidatus Levybacteria bacterium RIFCSPLOWO2_01_FULL_37_26]|nr:MAG: hypothetical protein A3E40_02600 [Candidatus Levybacteria bacterium RIFCSPHIGHO2_12_FULL_37_9]OGH37328.1 MAG: hypothetical protein A3B41_01560 [Candidatus Levybacteria bacterium RIFCSPLOWO2_01_FULL_37_26]